MRRHVVALVWLALTAGCGESRDVGASLASVPAPGSDVPTDADAIGVAGAAAEPASEAPAAPLPTEAPPGSVQMPALPEAPGPSTAGGLALDECGLDTGYPGDEYCILPPPPGMGFQIHIGPSNYVSPEPEYLLGVGQELTTNYDAISGNDTDVYFYYRQFRMRPGSHHNIVTTTDGGGFGTGRRIGTSNHLAEDTPKNGIIAPENQGVGIPLAPKSGVNVSLHSINVTSAPLLREVWVNFWYRDPALVTQPVEQMFEAGSMAFAVQPGEDTILGPYSCALTSPGRMLWMYGHRHANNVRFSTWRVRGAQRDLVYEGYNFEDPLVLEYSSIVQNPVPDEATGVEGGWSGVLDLAAGDVLEWECHVVNQTQGVLRFTNNTYTGEMCIVDAELVGTNCP